MGSREFGLDSVEDLMCGNRGISSVRSYLRALLASPQVELGFIPRMIYQPCRPEEELLQRMGQCGGLARWWRCGLQV